MEFFNSLLPPPEQPINQVYDRLSELCSEGYLKNKEAIASHLLYLQENYRTINHFLTKVSSTNEWPKLFGAQSFLIYSSDSILIRMNMWFPRLVNQSTPDSFRRYLSIEELHNHDFDFFTICLLGSGYETTFYEDLDYSSNRKIGETLDLVDKGRHTLNGKKVLFVHKDTDYHLQHWPKTFSVTLNIILPKKSTDHLTQYMVDHKTFKIKNVVSNKGA